MIKIGILTLHFSRNYGAVLQCTALIRALKNLNYEAIVIDYQHESARKYWVLWKSPLRAMKERYVTYEGGSFRRLLSIAKCGAETLCQNKYYLNRVRKDKAFRKFISANWKVSRCYYSSEELRKDPPGYDAYITGSDQVWNPQATQGKLDDGYLLNFDTKDKERIAYAASIGFTPDDSFIKGLIEKTSHFDDVSVREKSVWMQMQRIRPGYAKLVLDPTLLLTAESWSEYEEKVKFIQQKYALVYRLSNNPEFNLVVKHLKKVRKLTVIDLSPPEVKIPGCDQYASFCSPGEFLWYVHNCELIISDSFHATVFSIIYKKEFYSLLRSGMESRVKDLLDVCKLETQLIKKANQIPVKKQSCFFQECDAYLEQKREVSYSFLKKIGNLKSSEKRIY